MSFTSLLNTTCDIQQVTRTSDGQGGATEVWANIEAGVATAKFRPSASEQLIYQREGAVVTDRFYVVYRTDTDEWDRIVWDSKNFNIKGVRDMAGRNRFMVIETERVT